jgi:hypothetical protein
MRDAPSRPKSEMKYTAALYLSPIFIWAWFLHVGEKSHLKIHHRGGCFTPEVETPGQA